MASLTHVCMWSDHGWKRITAEQAARLHPGGTVSARSGLFMCELCGQYVTLTDGDINVYYSEDDIIKMLDDILMPAFFSPRYSAVPLPSGTGFQDREEIFPCELPAAAGIRPALIRDSLQHGIVHVNPQFSEIRWQTQFADE